MHAVPLAILPAGMATIRPPESIPRLHRADQLRTVPVAQIAIRSGTNISDPHLSAIDDAYSLSGLLRTRRLVVEFAGDALLEFKEIF